MKPLRVNELREVANRRLVCRASVVAITSRTPTGNVG